MARDYADELFQIDQANRAAHEKHLRELDLEQEKGTQARQTASAASDNELAQLKAKQALALSPEARKAAMEDALAKLSSDRAKLVQFYLQHGREKDALAVAQTPDETERIKIAASMYNAEKLAGSRENVATTAAGAKVEASAGHSRAMVEQSLARNPAFAMAAPTDKVAMIEGLMRDLPGLRGGAAGLAQGAMGASGGGAGLDINQPTPQAPTGAPQGRPDVPMPMGAGSSMAQAAVAPYNAPSANPQFTPDFAASLVRGPGNSFSQGAGPAAPRPGPTDPRSADGYMPMDKLAGYLQILDLVRQMKETHAPPQADLSPPPASPPPAAAPGPPPGLAGALAGGTVPPPDAGQPSPLAAIMQWIIGQHPPGGGGPSMPPPAPVAPPQDQGDIMGAGGAPQAGGGGVAALIQAIMQQFSQRDRGNEVPSGTAISGIAG